MMIKLNKFNKKMINRKNKLNKKMKKNKNKNKIKRMSKNSIK